VTHRLLLGALRKLRGQRDFALDMLRMAMADAAEQREQLRAVQVKLRMHEMAEAARVKAERKAARIR
jgi:hypothetical protein